MSQSWRKAFLSQLMCVNGHLHLKFFSSVRKWNRPSEMYLSDNDHYHYDVLHVNSDQLCLLYISSYTRNNCIFSLVWIASRQTDKQWAVWAAGRYLSNRRQLAHDKLVFITDSYLDFLPSPGISPCCVKWHRISLFAADVLQILYFTFEEQTNVKMQSFTQYSLLISASMLLSMGIYRYPL